jgi:hypothetical protein
MFTPADLPNVIAALKALLLAQDTLVAGLREHGPRSGLLGTCATKILRPARGTTDSGDHRSAATHRRIVRDRSRDPRQASG